MKKNDGPRINEEIRITECRLIGDDGEVFGVVTMHEARRIAEERALDLIEVSPNAVPPVVKLINYGKYKYALQKKASEAKKKQVVVQLKEIQFKPNIEKHDLETKLNKVSGFLDDGDKVKLVMMFRGREIAYKDAGMIKFKDILKTVLEMGAVADSDPSFMGNRIIVIVTPDKKAIPVKKKEN